MQGDFFLWLKKIAHI